MAASCSLVALLALAGCSSLPSGQPAGSPPAVDPATPAPAGTPLAAFETAQQQRAQDLERQGRLAEAAWAWEVLTVLRPANADYRESAAALRRQIDTAVADRLQRAQQAHKRGELDAASTQYLTLLSLQPDHVQAAEALRGIERERNRRLYLGKPSRQTLARRAPSAAEQKAVPAARAARGGQAVAAAPERIELEHAALLATQGELDEAIAQLERRVATDRRDGAARQQLADLYRRKAEQLAARNQKPAATSWLQKSLRLDATDARSLALLKQLRSNDPGDAAGGAAAVGNGRR
ncbi:hypothetical protein G8A07_23835 [Roseateles sp. DAIF2]|uniref:hypothetical protein n=1 Tax=Roseateles sp. DAIF2 TaxID=2714952 RepID=UPI0018A26566|nr:hypothetical protein [Roseateles sp. DAIF2]QPF75645.1 hypothetical protein G8A07_23835 [Roseateles sp. DAIF2]